MFTRVLTNLERKRIKEYLRTDGERDKAIQNLVYRARKHLPIIEQDIGLLERLVKNYDMKKTK